MTRKWWQPMTAYQIYPKSFLDTNGDGIGDIPGIIQKLDYLKALGVDILWLCPVYPSPLADQGYDISDYYGIDPRFGTMADMETLIAETKKRDMHLLMDLVVNHCSDQHPWFREACRDPEGKYGKYFYLKRHIEGEPLPCNWRSYFGGNCWEPLPGQPGWIYFHCFHKKQPDLNWENPELRQEIYRMVEWWLQKGLSGFRIDAIINVKKVQPFVSYPADREDGLCSMQVMLDHAQGVTDVLDELAEATFRKYDAFTVGEVCGEKPVELPAFIGEKGVFSSMFDFEAARIGASPKGWYDAKPVTAESYKQAIFRSQEKSQHVGFFSNFLENHDGPRSVSRYLPVRTPESKKMLAGLSLLLRGIPFLYQGQEFGMENFPYTSPEQMDDVSAISEYQNARNAGIPAEQALAAINRLSRDNGRTPMQWNGSEHAGFTSGTPWFPVNPNYPEINAAAQVDDPDSLWNFYRALIALRKDPKYRETLVYGDTVPYCPEIRNFVAYRRSGKPSVLVAANYSDAPLAAPIPAGKVLLSNYPDFHPEVPLRPWELVILEDA